MDPVTMFEQAGERTGKIVEQLAPGQLSAPTPCPDWDVRAVVNHLVAGNYVFAAGITGEPRPDMSTDFAGDDAAGAYRTSFEVARQAWRRPDALEKSVQLQIGPIPGAFALGLHVMDTLVHGWDLASGSGQDTTLDPELAEACIVVVNQMLANGPVPLSVFALPIEVPADADAGRRLLALTGRTAVTP